MITDPFIATFCSLVWWLGIFGGFCFAIVLIDEWYFG